MATTKTVIQMPGGFFHFGQPNSSSILLSFCEMSPLQHTSNVINRFVLLLVLPSPDIYIYIHLTW